MLRALSRAAQQVPRAACHCTRQQTVLHNTRRRMAMSAEDLSRNRDVGYYVVSAVVFVLGGSYAAVPLYRAFCQATGFGGTVNKHDDANKRIEDMTPVEEREIKIKFNADTSGTMQWKFRPQQREITVVPGETALAFYTAQNPTDESIIGMATYNVVPYDAGQYFNKIQCFCFEEQRLNPNEEVDMPIFFYIDPEFAEDPNLYKVDEITLSYTFFRSRDSSNTPLPVPGTSRAA